MVAPKSNNDIRLCVDLTSLNKAVRREVHPMASVDENLARIQNSRFFSKLDANSGFWQIPLDPSSRLLTTFITPFGCYCFNRLPFGISSAPEVFQRTMSRILEDLDGVVCQDWVRLVQWRLVQRRLVQNQLVQNQLVQRDYWSNTNWFKGIIGPMIT